MRLVQKALLAQRLRVHEMRLRDVSAERVSHQDRTSGVRAAKAQHVGEHRRLHFDSGQVRG